MAHLKVSIPSEMKPKRVKIIDMPYESLGISNCGCYYYRTLDSAICLNEAKMSYSPVRPDHGMMVTLFPSGSKIILEVP